MKDKLINATYNIIFTLTGLIILIQVAIWVCEYMNSPNDHQYQNTVTNKNTPSPLLQIVELGSVCNDNKECIPAHIVTGEVNKYMYLAIKDSISGSDKRLPYCFSSGGGDSKYAIKIIKLFRENNLTACVGSSYFVNNRKVSIRLLDHATPEDGAVCVSSCSIILMGSPRRTVFGEANVGIHNGLKVLDFCFCKIPLSDPLSPLQLDELEDIISTSKSEEHRSNFMNFYRFSQSISNDEVYILTKADWERFGLFNQRVIITPNN